MGLLLRRSCMIVESGLVGVSILDEHLNMFLCGDADCVDFRAFRRFWLLGPALSCEYSPSFSCRRY